MKNLTINSLSIVTFISNSEVFNEHIMRLYNELRTVYASVELIIFSDMEIIQRRGIVDKNIRQEISPKTTKYRRILTSIDISRAEHILYLDNDISPNFDNLCLFLREYRENIDLSFGRISISNPQNFIERLILIDKTLSHNFIRPLLWNLGIGISVPGQIFMIKKTKFAMDLDFFADTVFDDLALGVCARQNRYLVQRSHLILGYEKPSKTFFTLIKQRIRWAQGFYETFIHNANKKILFLIIIHGLAYHTLSMTLTLFLLLKAKYYPLSIIIAGIFTFAFLADFKLYRFLDVILYFTVFPIIHIAWFIALLRNAIINSKIYRNICVCFAKSRISQYFNRFKMK